MRVPWPHAKLAIFTDDFPHAVAPTACENLSHPYAKTFFVVVKLIGNPWELILPISEFVDKPACNPTCALSTVHARQIWGRAPVALRLRSSSTSAGPDRALFIRIIHGHTTSRWRAQRHRPPPLHLYQQIQGKWVPPLVQIWTSVMSHPCRANMTRLGSLILNRSKSIPFKI